MSRPLALILARNLLTSLTTPGFLVDAAGGIAFYNEAAGSLLGRRYEETGPMDAATWSGTFGPFAEDGSPLPYEELELTLALRGNRASHDRLRIRAIGGAEHDIDATGIPIHAEGGFHGAMVLFWPAAEAA
jgi:PAS domain-containing protein